MSLKSDLKVGVAGTGFIGPAHVEALRRLGIEVAGLSEIDVQRGQERAAALKIGKVYSSFEAMLADPSIDVVHITTPNYLHYPQVKAALLAGKHVICEKPLAMDSREGGELVALAKQKGLVNAINFNLRFYPLSHQAHAMLKSGELGDVYIVQGSYLQDWLLLPTDWNWRLEPGLGGDMRAVADIGSHWLDLVTFITSLDVEAVCADFHTFIPVRKKPTQAIDTFGGKLQTAIEYVEQPIHTEDYATVMLRFKGGARGVFTVSQVSAGRKNRLFYEISCAKSALAWDSERPNELWIGHRERPNESPVEGSLPAGSLSHGSTPRILAVTMKASRIRSSSFIRRSTAISQAGEQRGEPDFPTFADGQKELLIGDAILQSARGAGWVTL